MTQLRAATRLARLAGAADHQDAMAMLREVFGTFDEGFDTPDLLDARAVLNAASPDGHRSANDVGTQRG